MKKGNVEHHEIPNCGVTLAIASTAIRQRDGLYSLNDLHAAAGGDKAQLPANFMRLDQTQALVAEIGNSSDVRSFITAPGRNCGTYACRELVYAYAMRVVRLDDGHLNTGFGILQNCAEAADICWRQGFPPVRVTRSTRVVTTMAAIRLKWYYWQ